MSAAILDFQSKFYPELSFSGPELENLSWCVSNPIQTPSGPVTQIHYEVRRACNRLDLLNFLRAGGKDNYVLFSALNAKDPISFEQFELLSTRIQALSEDAFLALRASVIILSVSLSEEAKRRATAALGAHSLDSVDFLIETMLRCPEIYPAYQALSPEGQEFFRHGLEIGNFRHLIYVEGDQGMLKKFEIFCSLYEPADRKKFLEFSLLTWTMQIAGFLVKTDESSPRGSLYLNTRNMEAIFKWHDRLLSGAEAPEVIPGLLAQYLNYRREKLGRDFTDAQIKILAGFRIYTYGDDPVLCDAVRSITGESPVNTCSITPTYLPAVFASGVKLMPEDRPRAMAICYAIYQKYFSEYLSSPTRDLAPLCFRDLATESSIQRLFSYLSRHEFSSLPLFLDAQNNACVHTRKFNIALFPEDTSSFITWAQAYPAAPGRCPYRLNGETSVPHISVVQLETIDSPKEIALVLNLCREIMAEYQSLFELNLSGEIVSKKSQGPFAHVTWIEETIQEKPLLKDLQTALISKLATLGLPFSNAVGEKYSPHVTYTATLDPVVPELIASLTPEAPRDLSIRCKLRLGESDGYWQTRPISSPLTASLDWAECKDLRAATDLTPK